MEKPKKYYEKPEHCGYRKIAANLDPHDRERNPIGGLKYGRDNSGGREVDWDAEARKNAKKPRDPESR